LEYLIVPIKIPDNSPAEQILSNEGVELIYSGVALRQDIRPLRILLFNLMPIKIATEVQIARLLSHTPLQIELTLLTTSSYAPTHTSAEYLGTFYRTLEEIQTTRFDGMIVTGAPVEHLPFEAVTYWNEFQEIFAWSKGHVFRRFCLCWGAQAALFSEYGIDKVLVPKKLFGVFEQHVLDPKSPLLRGFPERFPTPVSRYAIVPPGTVGQHRDLNVLVDAFETGPCLIESRSTGDVYMLNHLEYDTDTLEQEYLRDMSMGQYIEGPTNYFEDDAAKRTPRNTWRPFGYLLFSNWIYLLYRDTPFDLSNFDRNIPARAIES
jgi:homoserine O-succinyltransferase